MNNTTQSVLVKVLTSILKILHPIMPYVTGEISKLKESIARREKLLSNENYVNKAPKNIVDLDRKKLEEEKLRLEQLIK